jgi:hypothetical protein
VLGSVCLSDFVYSAILLLGITSVLYEIWFIENMLNCCIYFSRCPGSVLVVLLSYLILSLNNLSLKMCNAPNNPLMMLIHHPLGLTMKLILM